MGIGFRVCKRERSVPSDLTERFRGLPVANISDVMSRVIGTRIPPVHGHGSALLGSALTVRTRPGDNLMVHKALDMGASGDVIIVDAGGELTTAIIGGLMVRYAVQRQIAGIVIDGAIRDSAEIRDLGLPVHAMGMSHRGPYKDGPGEINVPVSIGGMVVEPGDLIVGDEDGVVCVPYERVTEILELASKKSASEERQIAEIKEGKSDRSWVERALRKGGCELNAD